MKNKNIILGIVVLLLQVAAISCTPATPEKTLTIAISGEGSVSSNPAGISCGEDCTESYNEAIQVALTATADDGSSFSSWSGACEGKVNTCVVTMDAAKNVTANFAKLSSVCNNQIVLTATPSHNLAKGVKAVFTLNTNLPAGSRYRVWIGFWLRDFKGNANNYRVSASSRLEPVTNGVTRTGVPTHYENGEFDDFAVGTLAKWYIHVKNDEDILVCDETIPYQVTWQ